jgi:hypothetical protein
MDTRDRERDCLKQKTKDVYETENNMVKGNNF